MHIHVITAIVLLACATLNSADENCRKEGEFCDKTIFNRCCDNLVCDLQSIGNGKCVKYLDEGRLCAKDAECCSGRCHLLKCVPKEDSTTTPSHSTTH
uniref:Ubiquitin n=1 Tax=Spirometra erinaceieuropaei TaxID=99802 RepID=A0A0F6MV55_SPIER|nr:Ubiquitin [Spirometra erinaceieuropaei]